MAVAPRAMGAISVAIAGVAATVVRGMAFT